MGTELLLGQIANTNAQFLGKALAELGVNVYHQVVVGDNQSRLVDALGQALARSDVVITTGGLGPTADDLTREGVAAAVGRDLVFDERVWRDIEGFFQRVGRSPTPNNRRQAYVVEGSRVLDNPNGTAPGLIIPHDGKSVVMLPGPPAELIPMFERFVADYLRDLGAGREIIHSKILKVCMLGESAVEDRLRDLMTMGPNPTVAPYAYPGEVHLRLTARAGSVGAAQALIGPAEKRIRDVVGDYVFGSDDETIESAAGRRLRSLGLTVGLGESCTGGLIGHRLTQVPGSSDYFSGGVMAYSNEVKMRALGVKPATLRRYGAVSEETASE
ncbi:MAG: competence/damage-inducible protein A, partial [Bacillota bacterium]